MTMNRRTFLGRAACAGLAAGAGSLLAGCGAVTRSDLPRTGHKPRIGGPLDNRRRRILYYASLAPSGHNAQPWTVRIAGPDEWIIEADPSRLLPAVDPDNRETLLSLGAFTENLVLAAGVFGMGAEVEVLAREKTDPDVLRIRLSECRPSTYPVRRLEKRMTVKSGYLSRELAPSDVDAFASVLPGHLHYFPRGTDHARCIEEGAVECFRRQSLRDPAQKELVKWLRLNGTSARRHRDGLTTAGMEISGLQGFFVRHFVSPEDFLKTSFREQGIAHTAKLASQGAGWLVVTGAGETPADLVETGRRFEKMALLARERNIALHPMSQWMEEKWGRDKTAENHKASMTPRFLLRVGYVREYPEPVSLRRPVEWFLKKA